MQLLLFTCPDRWTILVQENIDDDEEQDDNEDDEDETKGAS